MTSRENIEALRLAVESLLEHLQAPEPGALEWWLTLDHRVTKAWGIWLLFTPMMLRVVFGPKAKPGEPPKSPQEAPKPAQTGQGSPTALPGPQRGARAPESTPKPAPTKPPGRFEQGGEDGMGFTNPEGRSCEPACKVCGSRMSDDRLTKRSKKAPDFKCASNKKPACKGAWWPNDFQTAWEEANKGKPAPDHYENGGDEVSGDRWRFVHVLTPDEEKAIHANARHA